MTLSLHLFLVPKNKESSLLYILTRRLKFIFTIFDIFSTDSLCLLYCPYYVAYIKYIACLHMHFKHRKEWNRQLPFRYTLFARVICALFFSILAAEKSGCVKHADFFFVWRS